MRAVTLRYADEQRDEAKYLRRIPSKAVPPEALKSAEKLIDARTAGFDAAKFVDRITVDV